MALQQASVLSRRQILAASGTVATLSLAGCARVVDWIADQVLEEVNVFNETDRQLTGTVEIRGPGGQSRLDESFVLDPQEDDDDGAPEDENEPNLATYSDVWADSGDYEATIELDGSVNGQQSATETVTIDDPDDQILLIALGAEERDEPIYFQVGESFTDSFGD